MKYSKPLLTAVFAATTILATPNFASAHDKAETASEKSVSADFVKNAAIGGMFEIKSSELALKRTKDMEVKTLAQHIINDHKKANAELKTIASKSLLPKALDEKHQTLLDELKAAPDAAFDSKYIDIQKQAHVEAIELFNNYVNYGEDEKLKDFAVKTLPTLEKHKEMIVNERIQPPKTKQSM